MAKAKYLWFYTIRNPNTNHGVILEMLRYEGSMVHSIKSDGITLKGKREPVTPRWESFGVKLSNIERRRLAQESNMEGKGFCIYCMGEFDAYCYYAGHIVEYLLLEMEDI